MLRKWLSGDETSHLKVCEGHAGETTHFLVGPDTLEDTWFQKHILMQICQSLLGRFVFVTL